MQLVILSLAIYNLKRDAPDNNKFKIPIKIPIHVAVAQFIWILVMTFMQKDIFSSLQALIVIRYDASVSKNFPDATWFYWIFSNLACMTVSIMNLVAAFFIIVQAENVLDLFKDFAALNFITELDKILLVAVLLVTKSNKLLRSLRKSNSHQRERNWNGSVGFPLLGFFWPWLVYLWKFDMINIMACTSRGNQHIA